MWIQYNHSSVTAQAVITQTETVIEDQIILHPAFAGVGDIINQKDDVSAITCGIECSSEIKCTAANFSPANKTCTLLHVGDVLDDWKEEDDAFYLCKNYEADFTGEYLYIWLSYVPKFIEAGMGLINYQQIYLYIEPVFTLLSRNVYINLMVVI